MIVRMDGFLAQTLIGAVGDDLVDVHVRLRTAAGLPDDERKMPVQCTGQNLVANSADRVRAPLIQRAETQIGARRRLFHHGERPDDLLRHALRADAEVFIAALRLRAPVPVGGHADLAHGIVLHTVFHCIPSPFFVK